jgi:hypothetical protein
MSTVKLNQELLGPYPPAMPTVNLSMPSTYSVLGGTPKKVRTWKTALTAFQAPSSAASSEAYPDIWHTSGIDHWYLSGLAEMLVQTEK